MMNLLYLAWVFPGRCWPERSCEQLRPRRDAPAVPRRPFAHERPLRVLLDVAESGTDFVEGRDVGIGALEIRHEVVATRGRGLGLVLVRPPHEARDARGGRERVAFVHHP